MANDRPTSGDRLGQLLVREKRISLEQLRRAQEEQRRTGVHLGAALVRLGIIEDREVTNFANPPPYRPPAIDLDTIELDPGLRGELSSASCVAEFVVPVGLTGDSLVVAMRETFTAEDVDAVFSRTGPRSRSIQPVTAPAPQLRAAVARFRRACGDVRPPAGPAADNYRELGALAFRPSRPQLAASRALVAETRDPAEAWEALAARGLIPVDRVDDPRRSFVAEPPRGAKLQVRPGGAAYSARPPDVATAALLAADPEGVARAESLAWELAARLRPWGVAPATVAWRVAASPRREDSWGMPGAFLDAVLEGAGADMWTDAPPPSALGAFDAVLSSGTEAFEAAWDAWFSELATTAGLAAPFEPLMELWRTGYLLDRVDPDALVLVAPGADATR